MYWRVTQQSVILPFLLAVATPAVPQAMPALNADAQRLPAWTRSVVKIFVRCNNDSRPWTGTGAVVSDTGLVLTAAHVGNACIGRSDISVRIGFVNDPYRGPPETYAATFVHRITDGNPNPDMEATRNSRRQDLALLQINPTRPMTFRPLAIDRTNPLPGEEVTVAGFSDAPLTGQTPTNIAGLTVFRSALINVAAANSGETYRLHYGGNTMKGASGGPVINARGQLIGVHSTRLDEGPGDLLTHFGWGTSVRAIPAGWVP